MLKLILLVFAGGALVVAPMAMAGHIPHQEARKRLLRPQPRLSRSARKPRGPWAGRRRPHRLRPAVAAEMKDPMDCEQDDYPIRR